MDRVSSAFRFLGGTNTGSLSLPVIFVLWFGYISLLFLTVNHRERGTVFLSDFPPLSFTVYSNWTVDICKRLCEVEEIHKRLREFEEINLMAKLFRWLWIARRKTRRTCLDFVQEFGLWSIKYTGTIERVAIAKGLFADKDSAEKSASILHYPVSLFCISWRTPPNPPPPSTLPPPPHDMCFIWICLLGRGGDGFRVALPFLCLLSTSCQAM